MAEAVFFIGKADSTTISKAAFASLFIPNELPKLVVFCTGSKFAESVVRHPYHSAPGVHNNR